MHLQSAKTGITQGVYLEHLHLMIQTWTKA